MRLTGDHLAEHFGKASDGALQAASPEKQAQALSVNVIYTGPEKTLMALRAADSLARDLGTTVHIRAMIPVPRQFAIELAFTSVQFLEGRVGDLVERAGTRGCEYVLHIYLCRDRIETLLGVLQPGSLVVIGGRKRLWLTAERRVFKAAISAGHSVAFVDVTAMRKEPR